MKNLSIEAKELINSLFEKWYSPNDIKEDMEDGAFLKAFSISQELAEEVHSFLSEPHIYEEIVRYHEERKMVPTFLEVPSLRGFLNRF